MYITISHAQHWTQTIGDMNLQDLYWHIVEMLEDNSARDAQMVEQVT